MVSWPSPGLKRYTSSPPASVITSLPSPAAVTTVVEGENGILGGLRSGCTWLDMSTNDMRELKRLAAGCLAKGVSTLETPVTGGIPLVHAGKITILVGGEPEVFEKQLPVL